ncbi:MAG: SPW repeat protein [Burkholderiaceae bacterium]
MTLAVDAFYPEIVEMGQLAVGIGLAASPWLLGYDGERAAMINALACGVAIAALSLVWTAEDIQREQREAR